MTWPRRRHNARDTYEPLLGTRVTVSIEARRANALAIGRAVAVEEIERLQGVFSMYDPASELSRWRNGDVARPSNELAAVLALAASLTDLTGGAFNPAAECLVSRWRQAEADGVLPDPTELAELVDVVEQRPPAAVSLNAIAKGAIVDWCVEKTFADADVERVVVNAGGDLLHRGLDPVIVGIEDPAARFDNVAPLTEVTLDNAALATSGSERRGFNVAGTRYGHVVDPRTGWPVDHVHSASVVAPSAATADALATAFMVLDPAESFVVAKRCGSVAVLIVTNDGTQHRNTAWSAIER